jgi:HPt (histidine-containing phosphotransfer) domain-containing protein
MVDRSSPADLSHPFLDSRLHVIIRNAAVEFILKEGAMIGRNGTTIYTTEVAPMSAPPDNWRAQPADGNPTKPLRNSAPRDEQAGDGQIVDVEGALRRLGGDRALLTCLAKVFNEDSPELLSHLVSAVGSMEGEQIRKAAHALRGLVANFGSQSLMQSLRELEDIGARDDLKRANELLADVSKKTARLQNSLTELS